MHTKPSNDFSIDPIYYPNYSTCLNYRVVVIMWKAAHILKVIHNYKNL